MKGGLTPKDYMKATRPESFSDTTIDYEAKLNRSLLEYHLDSLTSRNQERDFENFSVKLAQLEICPNLVVQTGPVGGGDGKTDSETYPISEFTALTLYNGIANSNNDKWAVAISAKKDWVSKVRSDVSKIIETNRGYTKIFFITNQFAKDKKRAELQDELSNKFLIDVIILDRNWILDTVFKNNRQTIAIENLNMDIDLLPKTSIGPMDLQRERDIQQLNNEIENDISNKNFGYNLIKASLKSAILSRELEKPQDEVYGMFERADRITRQYGTAEQLYTVKYQKAWTAYFWFEDYKTFLELVDQVDILANNTTNIFTAERQFNLLNLLRAMQAMDIVDEFYYREKVDRLKHLFTGFANFEAKPSAALQAKCHITLLELFDNINNIEAVKICAASLTDIIQNSTSLIGFPYETITGIIQIFGDELGRVEEFEALLNKIVEIDVSRTGGSTASASYLKYGLQHLKNNRIYKAIDYLGRSLLGFYKEESKDDLVKALYFISFAYEKAGLFWAARGVLINAANLSTSDFWLYNEINTLQIKCYDRLKNIELRLGRVGYSIEWYQLYSALSYQLAKSPKEREEIFKETYYRYGSLLGCLLIKTPTKKLPLLQKLPDSLIEKDLDFGAFPLMYLLNGGKDLPMDFVNAIAEPLDVFFGRWASQPAQNDLPPEPELYDEDYINLKSNILGAAYILKCPNKLIAIELAESILATIESFLSTLITKLAVSRVSRIEIILKENYNINNPLSYDSKRIDFENIVIEYHPFDPSELNNEQVEKIGQSVFHIIAIIIANTIHIDDTENILNLFATENVNSRTALVSSLVATTNILGRSPKTSALDWTKKGGKEYHFQPDAYREIKIPEMNSEPKSENDLKGDTTDFDYLSHSDIKTFSVIREQLWDDAQWKGVFFLDNGPNSTSPPYFGIGFTNEFSGKEIFRKWRDEFGENLEENIEITILKGINEKEPFWYTVVIYPKLSAEVTNPNQKWILMYRMHTMTPGNNRNLTRFTDIYERSGFCYLIQGHFKSETELPVFDAKNTFRFKNLRIKFAWEIGINDLAAAGIGQEYYPFIPVEIKEAPVLEILNSRKRNTKR